MCVITDWIIEVYSRIYNHDIDYQKVVQLFVRHKQQRRDINRIPIYFQNQFDVVFKSKMKSIDWRLEEDLYSGKATSLITRLEMNYYDASTESNVMNNYKKISL